MTYHRAAVIPLLAFSLLAAACGDDPTGPDETRSGTVSFSYAGGISGTFRAEGEVRFRADGDPEFGTWAAGARTANDLAVIGFRAQTAPRGDLFGLAVPEVTGPKTVQIEADCEDEDCPGAGLFFGIDTQGDGSEFERICVLTSGTIQVTSISSDRAGGTFQGAGFCVRDFSSNDLQPIVVSNGNFDVPLIEELEPDA